MIRIAEPQIGREEEEAVLAVLRSGRLVQGPRVAEFESAFARYLGVEHAVAVASGTAALSIAMRAHGLGPGDEVLVPAFTYAATANAVLLAGATPVLVDVRDDDLTIESDALEAAATPRTRAVVPVHLFGHPCDMTAVIAFAEGRGLAVIEDAAQAAGASWRGRPAGSFGTGCFSFYATKNMTTGEGGMITTEDAELTARARMLRNQGEAERYVTQALGGNERMTEIEAALGLVQVAKLDEHNERRRANAAALDARLAGVRTPVEREGARHVYSLYTVRAPNRDALQAALREREIESVVYYERCLHQQPLYVERGIGGSFPVAERAAAQVLSLPVHPGLTPDDLDRIAGAVNEAMATAGASRG